MSELSALVNGLRSAPFLLPKRDIARAAAAFPRASRCAWLPEGAESIRNGDDAAAIPDGDGYTLLAAEGMLGEFVRRDPFFAGFSAIMVNVNDILAMGGRPLAVVDVLFAADAARERAVMAGMAEAAQRFGVPVVGGHCSRSSSDDTALAVAIVGRAKRLITSFDARPNDVLLTAIDLRGRYHGHSYYDAASDAPAAQLRAQAAILPSLAEDGLVRAGKDVSMASFAGTLIMLCESSGVGATLDLDALPRPSGVAHAHWLGSFPSFGFLLSVQPDHAERVIARFEALGIACAISGRFEEDAVVNLRRGGKRVPLWDLRHEPLTGFAGPY